MKKEIFHVKKKKKEKKNTKTPRKSIHSFSSSFLSQRYLRMRIEHIHLNKQESLIFHLLYLLWCYPFFFYFITFSFHLFSRKIRVFCQLLEMVVLLTTSFNYFQLRPKKDRMCVNRIFGELWFFFFSFSLTFSLIIFFASFSFISWNLSKDWFLLEVGTSFILFLLLK